MAQMIPLSLVHICRCLADLFQRIFCLALSVPVSLDFNLSIGIGFNWYLNRLIKPRFWSPLGASGGPFPLINLSGITHSGISRPYSLIWNRFHVVSPPIDQTHFFQDFGGPWVACPADKTRQTLSTAKVHWRTMWTHYPLLVPWSTDETPLSWRTIGPV